MGLLHVVTKGKVETMSVVGHNYFLATVEEVSRHITVILITFKKDASDELLSYIARFERLATWKVKSVHSKRASEFNTALNNSGQTDVNTSRTPHFTPQSNGLSKW